MHELSTATGIVNIVGKVTKNKPDF